MPTTKPVLAVDFDDVLMDFTDALRIYHNAQYGTTRTFEELLYFELENSFGCSVDEMKQRILEFYLSPHHEIIKPLHGAVQAMYRLSQHYTLEIVTARPAHMRERTTALLERHFVSLFRELHFTSHYYAPKSERISKAVMCKRIGAVAFIEDALHNAIDVAQVGIPVYLFDKPWNQSELISGITRFKSWKELVKDLERLRQTQT